MHTHDETRLQASSVEDRAAQGAENMQAPEQAFASSPDTPHPTFYNMWDTNTLNPQDNTSFKNPPSFRFDWYQATLNPEVEPLEALRWAQFLGESKPLRGMHGYEKGHDFGQVKIMFGGHSGKYGVHVIIHGGDACADIVQSFRTAFPDHRPSRVDVCMDFQSPHAWDKLSKLGIKAAGRHSIMTNTMGDWLQAKRGRTLYIGANQGVFKARIYEKGHEMRAKGKMPDAPLDWVRLEFQIKPPRHSRHDAATLMPDQFARASHWTAFICNNLQTADAEVVKLNTRRKTPEVVDSFEYMAAQYCRVIAEIRRDEWMTEEQFKQVMLDLWRTGDFKGLPQEILRNWYF